MIRYFRICRALGIALLLTAMYGVADAGIHRGDFPGRGRLGRYVTIGPSDPSPAQGAPEAAPGHEVVPPAGFQDGAAGGTGSDCETPVPGGGAYCVHPGLQKPRGE